MATQVVRVRTTVRIRRRGLGGWLGSLAGAPFRVAATAVGNPVPAMVSPKCTCEETAQLAITNGYGRCDAGHYWVRTETGARKCN